PGNKPAVSVTLIAGPLGAGVSVDRYAQTWLAANTVQSSRDEVRQGARGKFYLFASPDGAMRQALLLLAESAELRTGLPPTPTPRPASSASPSPPPGRVSLTVRPSPTPVPTVPPSMEAAPTAWVYGLYAQGEAAAFESQLPAVEEM